MIKLPVGLSQESKDVDLVSVVQESDQKFPTLYELELRYIIKALELYDNNKTQAAMALGITVKTLYNKLHEHGLFEKYATYRKAEK